MGKEVPEIIASKLLLDVLSYFRILRADALVHRSDYLCFQNVCRGQIKSPVIHNSENAVSGTLVRCWNDNKIATLNKKTRKSVTLFFVKFREIFSIAIWHFQTSAAGCQASSREDG